MSADTGYGHTVEGVFIDIADAKSSFWSERHRVLIRCDEITAIELHGGSSWIHVGDKFYAGVSQQQAEQVIDTLSKIGKTVLKPGAGPPVEPPPPNLDF